MPVSVVRVNAPVGVGGRGCSIKASDPLLVVVTGGIAVGLIVNVIKVVEGTVFIVNAGIEHSNDHAFPVIASGISARGIDIGRHRADSLARNTVEGHHEVLHLDDNHAIKMVNVEQSAHRNLVNNHRINRVHDLEPGSCLFTNPTVCLQCFDQGGDFFVVWRPCIINHDGNRFATVRAHDRC